MNSNCFMGLLAHRLDLSKTMLFIKKHRNKNMLKKVQVLVGEE